MPNTDSICSPHFEEALETLRSSECHPGAVCRTRIALSESYEQCGDFEAAAEQCKLAEPSRLEIQDVDKGDSGQDAAKYDRFVPVGLR